MASLDALHPQDIRRDIPIPLHYQLTELLRQMIDSGGWKVGEQIPAEEDLCAYFDLSRTTVRKALDALVNAELVQRKKRRTFVAEPKLVEGLVNRAVGFFDDMAERGIHVTTQVLDIREIQPSETVAQQLELRPGETVIAIDRLRFIQNEPVVLVSGYVPSRLCPTLFQVDLTNTGLYTVLRKNLGFKIGRAKRFVEAVLANDNEARLLQVKRGSPLLLIESTVYLDNGSPIDYYKARHRGDRLRLIIETAGQDRVETK